MRLPALRRSLRCSTRISAVLRSRRAADPAKPLQILLSVRSERQLIEQMDYNLMSDWFVGLGIHDPAWVPTVFTKNRDRLVTTAMSRRMRAAILAHREMAPFLLDDQFSVAGTLVKAWASMKSFHATADATPPDDVRPGDPPPLRPLPSPRIPSPQPRQTRCSAAAAATAMPRSTSRARSIPTPPIPQPPIRMRAFTRNPPAGVPCRA